MSPIYERSYGFSHYCEWATSILQIGSVKPNKIKGRHLILCSLSIPVLLQSLLILLVQEQITPKKCVCSGMGDNIEVKKADEVTFSELCDYDDSITNSRREDFIRFTAVFREDAICKVIINENEKIVGFGRIRQSFNGSLIIGPIYCDSDANFIALFKSLIESYSKNISTSTNITMRSPSIKTTQIANLLRGAAEIMEISKLQPQFTKCVPHHDISKIYAITDLFVFL
uniref:Acetyltransf_18 domain-containing protein n=1 Tax=Ascaris lumbricoides TaxID=6252 RepID=A0A0M3IQI6_ASCLU